MSFPKEINAVLLVFQSAFTAPTWAKVKVLLAGTLLVRGRRTVTAALRQMGLGKETHFSHYHHVLNRARWSQLACSRRLLVLVVGTFCRLGVPVTLVFDETLERRWGKRIRLRGHYRDRLGQRHKTVAQRAQQVVRIIRRWLPAVQLTVTGDQAYSVLALGVTCRLCDIRLVAPLRLDARLFQPAPEPVAKQVGRPRVIGARLPKLSEVLKASDTDWQVIRVRWYDQCWHEIQIATGTSVWYRCGHAPLPLRWVLVRDPKGQLQPRAYFSTVLDDTPESILTTFIQRWTIEVTFEECRTHLGIETQRQWSDTAIARTTPVLLGLYSLVALFAQALFPDGRVPVQTSAWYRKSQATSSDVLAAVRRHLWGGFDFPTTTHDPDLVEIPSSVLQRFENALCYAH